MRSAKDACVSWRRLRAKDMSLPSLAMARSTDIGRSNEII